MHKYSRAPTKRAREKKQKGIVGLNSINQDANIRLPFVCLVTEWINSNRLYVISLWAMRLDMNMKQSSCTRIIYQKAI